ncbi:hypothetical protein CPB85DRAFT_176780 [Mucidula mucida]|nr:hypothetical protein CPB85DRAFT_176780 [Mucidula mucida]
MDSISQVVPATSTLMGMPTELLITILHIVVDVTTPHDEQLLKLTRVCRRLGVVICGTPSLWQNILIYACDACYGDAYSLVDVFRTTRLALKYSGTLPIAISIILPSNPPAYPEPPHFVATEFTPFSMHHCARLMDMIVKESRRIRCIEVFGEYWPFHLTVTRALARADLPLLQQWAHTCELYDDVSLTDDFEDAGFINSTSASDMLTYPVPGPIFGRHEELSVQLQRNKTPLLQKVAITGAYYYWTNFSASNLTELRLANQPFLDRPRPAALRRILSLSKDTLELLELRFVLEYPDPPKVEGPALVLNKLKSLLLGYTAPDELTDFLDTISVPHLHRFELTAIAEAPFHGNCEMLSKIIENIPLQQIEEMTLDNVYIHDPVGQVSFLGGKVPEYMLHPGLRLIRRMRNLRNLTVIGPTLDLMEYAICLLSRHRSDSFPLPSLQKWWITARDWNEGLHILHYLKIVKDLADIHDGCVLLKRHVDIVFDFSASDPKWLKMGWNLGGKELLEEPIFQDCVSYMFTSQ